MGPAGVLAAVHQDQVADQEGQAQHDVHISEIIFLSERERERERVHLIGWSTLNYCDPSCVLF